MVQKDGSLKLAIEHDDKKFKQERNEEFDFIVGKCSKKKGMVILGMCNALVALVGFGFFN